VLENSSHTEDASIIPVRTIRGAITINNMELGIFLLETINRNSINSTMLKTVFIYTLLL